MTVATCQGRGCTAELPPRARKWCSEACRRRTLYAGVCRSCGGPTDGSNGAASAPEYCGACAHEIRFGGRNRRLAEMWMADAPAAEIAAELNMSCSAVVEAARRLRAEGLPLETRALPGRGEVVAARDAEIIQLWNDGVSSEEIAKRFGFASPESLVTRVSVLRRQGRGLKPRAIRLSPEAVDEIRERYAGGRVTQSALALDYDVHVNTIHKIVTQQTHARLKAAA